MAVVGQVVRMTLDHGQKMQPMIEVGRLAEFSNIWQTLCYSDGCYMFRGITCLISKTVLSI